MAEPEIKAEYKELASKDGITLWAVEKIWAQVDFPSGGENHRLGFNVVPPVGKEIVIAVGYISSPQEVPEGVLTSEEFKKELAKFADYLNYYKNEQLSNKSKTSF